MNKMLLENKNYNLDEIFEIILDKPSIHLDDSIKKIVKVLNLIIYYVLLPFTILIKMIKRDP